jgi:hypothetical protein
MSVTKLPAKVARLRDPQIMAGITLLIFRDIKRLKVSFTAIVNCFSATEAYYISVSAFWILSGGTFFEGYFLGACKTKNTKHPTRDRPLMLQ